MIIFINVMGPFHLCIYDLIQKQDVIKLLNFCR